MQNLQVEINLTKSQAANLEELGWYIDLFKNEDEGWGYGPDTVAMSAQKTNVGEWADVVKEILKVEKILGFDVICETDQCGVPIIYFHVIDSKYRESDQHAPQELDKLIQILGGWSLAQYMYGFEEEKRELLINLFGDNIFTDPVAAMKYAELSAPKGLYNYNNTTYLISGYSVGMEYKRLMPRINYINLSDKDSVVIYSRSVHDFLKNFKFIPS